MNYQSSALEGIIHTLRHAEAGRRNAALFAACCQLWEVAPEHAEDIAMREGMDLGLHPNEIRDTVASARDKTAGRHGSRVGTAPAPSATRRHAPPVAPCAPRAIVPTYHTNPPPSAWQAGADALLSAGVRALHDERGAPARAYLASRGIAPTTATATVLGWVPSRIPVDLGMGRPVPIPRGILLPVLGRQCTAWRISIRYLPEDVTDGVKQRRVPSPEPRAQRLWSAPWRGHPGSPAVLVEGEIDALTLAQVLPSHWAVYATGGATNCRTPGCVSQIIHHSPVVVWMDDDAAGHDARAWWGKWLPDAPLHSGADANSILLAHGASAVVDTVMEVA